VEVFQHQAGCGAGLPASARALLSEPPWRSSRRMQDKLQRVLIVEDDLAFSDYLMNGG